MEKCARLLGSIDERIGVLIENQQKAMGEKPPTDTATRQIRRTGAMIGHEYQVDHLSDDVYQVVVYQVDSYTYEADPESMQILYQGSLADCASYIRLKRDTESTLKG